LGERVPLSDDLVSRFGNLITLMCERVAIRGGARKLLGELTSLGKNRVSLIQRGVTPRYRSVSLLLKSSLQRSECRKLI
jgi:hypothetical protein